MFSGLACIHSYHLRYNSGARIIVMSCQVRKNLNLNLINPSLNLFGFSQEPAKPILIDYLFTC